MVEKAAADLALVAAALGAGGIVAVLALGAARRLALGRRRGGLRRGGRWGLGILATVDEVALGTVVARLEAVALEGCQ